MDYDKEEIFKDFSDLVSNYWDVLNRWEGHAFVEDKEADQMTDYIINLMDKYKLR